VIIRCPSCGYLMSTEQGCTNCHPREVRHRRKKNSESKKVEGSTGEDMPSPAVQKSLVFL
jgi:hypothetical protein